MTAETIERPITQESEESFDAHDDDVIAGTGILRELFPYAPDHRGALVKADTCVPRGQSWQRLARVDAIIVPTHRGDVDLTHLMEAAAAGARMMILIASKQNQADDIRDTVHTLQPGIPVLVISLEDYSWLYRPAGLELQRHLRWSKDTALKRNMGLLIARQLGLRHVLFVDDDVAGLSGPMIRHGLSEMMARRLFAAGWSFTDFPDNSVASHAYRQFTGEPVGEQACFIGGGGLLVRLHDNVPHFPLGIYNEDWFFLIACLLNDRVALLGELDQQDYLPFARIGNAQAQEFGDMIAESIMSEFPRVGVESLSEFITRILSKNFHDETIAKRRKFLDSLLLSIGTADENSQARASVQESVDAAAQIMSHQLRAWLRAWLRDGDSWSTVWRSVSAEPIGVEGPLRQKNLEQRITEAMDALRLNHRFQIIWEAPPLPRHRIPEQVRSRVPQLIKTRLASPYDMVGIALAGWLCVIWSLVFVLRGLTLNSVDQVRQAPSAVNSAGVSSRALARCVPILFLGLVRPRPMHRFTE